MAYSKLLKHSLVLQAAWDERKCFPSCHPMWPGNEARLFIIVMQGESLGTRLHIEPHSTVTIELVELVEVHHVLTRTHPPCS